MTETTPGLITIAKALARASADPNARALEELQARHWDSVKEAEDECGPDVPSVYLHLLPRVGRPKKGQVVEQVQSKAVKMPPIVWKELKTLSGKKGMTLHALIRVALLEYLAKEQQPQA
jgi:hypothetical protein